MYFFGSGYRLKYETTKDYLKQGVNAVEKVRECIMNVKFMSPCSYTTINVKGYLIYCDPPYLNNKYAKQNPFFKFDHVKFWNVMREWSQDNIVLISEHTAPDDFICVWEKSYNQTIGRVKNTIYTEKLFLFKDLYYSGLTNSNQIS